MAGHRKMNRLEKEKSPYLLQHANNPVDWYPWGDEAFEAAKARDRPIFLSIGYSSCHWCHVMERECFEDEETADLLNSNFVSIKVDREERPDIDDIYMKVCHMMTGSGGWPLTIIMTPEKMPFFAATFVPKKSRGGMTGLMDLVPIVSRTWNDRREEIDEVTRQVSEQLATLGHKEPNDIDTELNEKALGILTSNYEEKFGGFEVSPKFPSSHKLMFLLRLWKRTGSREALEMATYTLQAISRGGIHDHVGRGFHRYSTDRRWVVPHFEKMLYDQAMLAMAFTEAYQATKNEWFKKVASWTLDYVLNDLSAPEGGFYSSEDADSEGKEGDFYTWKYDEVKDALGVEDISIFVDAFDVREDGNFRQESNGMYNGRNILHMTNDIENIALQRYVPVSTVSSSMWVGLNRLKKERDKRMRPARDEKVLLDWNGLMIAALAKSGRAFSEKKYLDQCRRAVDFIEKGANGPKGLRHRFKEGEWAVPGFLTDHAFYSWGLLELYQATADDRYLQLATKYCEEMAKKFQDGEGGFFLAAPDPQLISRSKELYDGAIPSGNSVALFVLSTLYHLTRQERHKEWAERCARYFQSDVKERPDAYCFFLMGQERLIGNVLGVCLVDGGDEPSMKGMRDLLDRDFHPEAVLRFCLTNEQASSMRKKIVEGKASAYVCRNGTCLPPAFDAAALEKLIKG